MTLNFEDVTFPSLSEKEYLVLELINKYNLSKDIGDAMEGDGIISDDEMVRYNIEIPETLIQEYEKEFGSSADFDENLSSVLNKAFDCYLSLPTE